MARILMAAAGIAITCAPASAQLSISFEELGTQPNVFASTDPLRSQILGAVFAGPGPTDGGAVLNQDGNFGVPAYSGQHFLAFNSVARMVSGGLARLPETIVLDDTASSVSIWAAGGGNVDLFTMEAFDTGGALLDSVQVSTQDWAQLAISARGIKSIRLSATGDGIYVFDDLEAASEGCYADCDSSTGVGVLDIFDFLCFQNRFAVGSGYACDCDTATGTGVCDIFDFLCFQNSFAAGCP